MSYGLIAMSVASVGEIIMAFLSDLTSAFGVGELVIILLIVLVIFWNNNLPGIREGLGQGIENFRQSIKSPDSLPALLEKEKREYSSPTMFGFGIGELILILLIVLVVFGANKLPSIGEGVGKAIQNFRKAIKSPDSIDVTPERKADEQTDEKH